MRIGVINETSAADRNADIIAALNETSTHEILNIGMKENFAKPELTYIHTGFLSSLLLHLNRVDFVVGGCGTGQGFLNSVLQYPGVICGLIATPLDAWLFTQINGGNCISLRLNQGYGWASNENLKFIFERIFSVEIGCGYPPHRQESQQQSLRTLKRVSQASHKSFVDIILSLPDSVVRAAINYPGVLDLLDLDNISDQGLSSVIRNYI
jgi:ribose 5-phosphate isomerase RpiB